MLYNHLHVGIRSNVNVTTLIQLWQSKRFAITMALPASLFTDRMTVAGGASSSAQPTIQKMQMITIVTGKLFLDYADILLPKGHQCYKLNAVTSTTQAYLKIVWYWSTVFVMPKLHSCQDRERNLLQNMHII